MSRRSPSVCQHRIVSVLRLVFALFSERRREEAAVCHLELRLCLVSVLVSTSQRLAKITTHLALATCPSVAQTCCYLLTSLPLSAKRHTPVLTIMFGSWSCHRLHCDPMIVSNMKVSPIRYMHQNSGFIPSPSLSSCRFWPEWSQTYLKA